MASTIANVEMADAWDGDEGAAWARDWEHYDRGFRGYHERLVDAAAISDGERVLDIGCGNGESTRDAARATPRGRALGVDLSSLMIERARSLAEVEGLANVRFERGDAQVHPFEPDDQDLALSRFGAMFFGDPHAAFTNIGRALRSGGRLALVAWQGLEENEWLQTIRGSLAVGRELPSPATGAPGPFGLADPDRVASLLAAAGFGDVELTALREPFWAGADASDAFTFLSNSGPARGLLDGLEPASRARALDGLRAAMTAHDTGDGVYFGSAAWLVTARRLAR
jgi:SAM-dependent methyltransferase